MDSCLAAPPHTDRKGTGQALRSKHQPRHRQEGKDWRQSDFYCCSYQQEQRFDDQNSQRGINLHPANVSLRRNEASWVVPFGSTQSTHKDHKWNRRNLCQAGSKMFGRPALRTRGKTFRFCTTRREDHVQKRTQLRQTH